MKLIATTSVVLLLLCFGITSSTQERVQAGGDTATVYVSADMPTRSPDDMEVRL